MFKSKSSVCKRCGNHYIQTSPNQKFCGSLTNKQGCSKLNELEDNRSYNRRYNFQIGLVKDIRGPLTGRICKLCDKKFNALGGQQIYCGSKKDKTGCSYIASKSYLINPKRRVTRGRRQRLLKLRFMTLKRFNYTCQYCGRKAPDVVLEVDHIIPKSRGGTDGLGNYTVACKECNIGKSDVLL